MAENHEKSQKDNALEQELASKQRKHPKGRYKGTNMLTAEEEAQARRAPKNKRSTAKKYDGRKYGAGRSGSNLPRVREALDNFYEEIKLPELKTALHMADDPRYMMLLGALGNPKWINTSFAELCSKCRLSMNDVVNAWRNYQNTRTLVRTMSHMPEMMESTVIDGISRVVTCPECQGTGKLKDKEINKIKNPVCPECHGDGTIRLIGDKDSRNLAAEVVGLKKSGSIMQINQVNVGKGLSSVEDEIARMEKADIIDVEYEEVQDVVHEERSQTAEESTQGNEGNEAAVAEIAGTAEAEDGGS
jgi:hypothetical protein